MVQAFQRAAGFQQHQLAFDVGVGIGIGIDHGIAHPGLRRQMDDPGDAAVPFNQITDRRLVGDVQAFEPKAFVCAENVQARLLQGNVVIIVEIIDADNLVAPLQKRARGMKTDESGGAGNQDSHECAIRVSVKPLSYTRSGRKNHLIVRAEANKGFSDPGPPGDCRRRSPVLR